MRKNRSKKRNNSESDAEEEEDDDRRSKKGRQKANKANDNNTMTSPNTTAQRVVDQSLDIKTINNYKGIHMYIYVLCHTTVFMFVGKLNKMKLFLMSHRTYISQCFDANGNFVIPFSMAVVQEIFAWLSTDDSLTFRGRRRNNIVESTTDPVGNAEEDDEDDDGDGNVDGDSGNLFDESIHKATISVSCMQGYKSAIGWYYKLRHLKLSPEIDDWVENFIQGYTRIIARKRESGVMKIREGKSHLTYVGMYAHAMKYINIYIST